MSTDTGVSVRVRGIYSTALTKLFLDRGFGISQPSNRIVERFNLEKTYDEFDVDVYDKKDHHGVILVGTKVEEVKAALAKGCIPVHSSMMAFILGWVSQNFLQVLIISFSALS